MDEFFKRAQDDLFPKMRASALSVTILASEPDPKLCMELGAAILFDKPILLLVPDPDHAIPSNLSRVASAIITGDPADPRTQQKMQDAIAAILENDKRVRKADVSSSSPSQD